MAAPLGEEPSPSGEGSPRLLDIDEARAGKEEEDRLLDLSVAKKRLTVLGEKNLEQMTSLHFAAQVFRFIT